MLSKIKVELSLLRMLGLNINIGCAADDTVQLHINNITIRLNLGKEMKRYVVVQSFSLSSAPSSTSPISSALGWSSESVSSALGGSSEVDWEHCTKRSPYSYAHFV